MTLKPKQFWVKSIPKKMQHINAVLSIFSAFLLLYKQISFYSFFEFLNLAVLDFREAEIVLISFVKKQTIDISIHSTAQMEYMALTFCHHHDGSLWNNGVAECQRFSRILLSIILYFWHSESGPQKRSDEQVSKTKHTKKISKLFDFGFFIILEALLILSCVSSHQFSYLWWLFCVFAVDIRLLCLMNTFVVRLAPNKRKFVLSTCGKSVIGLQNS